MQSLTRIFDLLENCLKYAVAVLCLVLLGVLFMQVLNRYIFGVSWPVISFIIPFCFLWLCMLGSAIGVRQNVHFEVDLFSNVLKGKLHLFHKVFLAFSVFAAGGLIAWTAVGFAELGLMKKNPATGVKMIYIYMSLMIGGALISLMAVEKLLILFFSDQSAAEEVET